MCKLYFSVTKVYAEFNKYSSTRHTVGCDVSQPAHAYFTKALRFEAFVFHWIAFAMANGNDMASKCKAQYI